jgi:hypothetical protein
MMLIALNSFGRIWTCRADREEGGAHRRTAFYNTTGVPVGDGVRHRSCVYGHVRLNGCWGFRPENAERILHRIFESEGLVIRDGHRKLFLRAPAVASFPDRYLLAITSETVGWMDRGDAWTRANAEVLSFSESRDRQEALLLLPAFGWVHGASGTFCLLPDDENPARSYLRSVAE